MVLHFRPRNDIGARRRGGGGGGIAAGVGCEDHVAVGGSATSGWNAAASARRRWGVDGTDWRQERRGEVARDVGVESAGAASFMPVTRLTRGPEVGPSIIHKHDAFLARSAR